MHMVKSCTSAHLCDWCPGHSARKVTGAGVGGHCSGWRVITLRSAQKSGAALSVPESASSVRRSLCQVEGSREHPMVHNPIVMELDGPTMGLKQTC
jgi:hypothetical protein